MTTFDKLNREFGDRLANDFARIFNTDVTPNPKGATPTREALDERSGERSQAGES